MSVMWKRRPPSFLPPTMPYRDVSSADTSISATTGLPVSSKTWRICSRHGSSERMTSSGSTTANGSLPTASFACSTAWPRPSASFWRTEMISAIRLTASTSASRSSFPRSDSERSSSAVRSKWSRMASFPFDMTMTSLSRPELRASSIPYCRIGRSTSGSISFGMTLVAGKKRVPKPAQGKTQVRRFILRIYIGGEVASSDVVTSDRMRKSLILLAILTALPAAAQWRRANLYGADVRALIVDPASPDTVYVGTSGGEVYVSSDGARTWRNPRGGVPFPGYVVDNLVIDRTGRLWAACWGLWDGGVVAVSDDGGATWTRRDAGLEEQSIRAIAIDPHDADFVIVGGLAGVWRS